MTGAPPRGVVGLVGAGATGPTIVGALVARGWRAGRIASRTIERARAAAARLNAEVVANNAAAAEGADLLVLAVPDREIAGVAAEIAAGGRLAIGAAAIHLSGALASDVLAPLAAVGAAVGSIHPLQSFAGAGAAERLATTAIFVEGDPIERFEAIARDLSDRVHRLPRGGKILYHAGAAAASNLFAAMVDLGVRLFGAAGIAREDALSALLPLVEGTVANLKTVGLPAALTGPVARGDVEIVRLHLERMAESCPELAAVYAAASRHAATVAREKGTLSEAAHADLLRLLARFA